MSGLIPLPTQPRVGILPRGFVCAGPRIAATDFTAGPVQATTGPGKRRAASHDTDRHAGDNQQQDNESEQKFGHR